MKKIMIVLALMSIMSYANELEIRITNTTYSTKKVDTASFEAVLRLEDTNLKKLTDFSKQKANEFIKKITSTNLATASLLDYSYSKVVEDNNKLKKNLKIETTVTFMSDKMSKLANSSYKREYNGRDVYHLVFTETGKSSLENLEKINKKIKNIKEELIYVDSQNREYFEREKQQKYVVVQTFNIEVKDIKNISKVIDLAKNYDMKIDSPNFYIKNSEYDIKEEVSKAREFAKLIASNLDYKLTDKYVLKNIYMNKNKPYRHDTYYNSRKYMALEAKTSIETPTEDQSVRARVNFYAKNDSNKKLNNEIMIYVTSKIETSDSTAKIHISINDDKKISKLKSVLKKAGIKPEISTKNYYTQIVEKDVPILKKDEYISFMINFTNVNKDNFIYLVRKYPNLNEGKIEIKAKTYENATKEYNKIANELKKYNISASIDSYKNISNDIVVGNKKVKETKVHHDLYIKTDDINDVGLITSICQELGINIPYISFEQDRNKLEKELYIQAINAAKKNLKEFGQYEITAITTSDTNNDYKYVYYPNLYFDNNKMSVNMSDDEILENSIANYVDVPSRTIEISKTLEIEAKVEK